MDVTCICYVCACSVGVSGAIDQMLSDTCVDIVVLGVEVVEWHLCLHVTQCS